MDVLSRLISGPEPHRTSAVLHIDTMWHVADNSYLTQHLTLRQLTGGHTVAVLAAGWIQLTGATLPEVSRCHMFGSCIDAFHD